MLLLFLTILINSMACWYWGYSFIGRFYDDSLKNDRLFFNMLAGMMLLTVLTAIISLFGYSGYLYEGLIPASAILVLLRRKTRQAILEQWRALSIRGYAVVILLAASLLLLLILGSRSIYHPDTLAYHAPIINWIKSYQSVPGIVHLNNRYGLQSAWFITAALSSSRFLSGNEVAYNAANLTLLSWFILLIISKASAVTSSPKANNIGWLLLALLGWMCFTQIRLTAISASPDFPAALFCLSGIYFMLNGRDGSNGFQYLAAFLLLVFAIAIKLSCIPFIIPAVYCKIQWLKKKGILSTVVMGLSGLLIYLPFAIRSVIASGYPFYPATAFRMSSVDWVYNDSLARLQEKYITAWARVNGINYDQVDSTLGLSLSQWIPSWWSNLYWADKLMMILVMTSFVLLLLNYKRVRALSPEWKIAVLTAVVGIVFWFWRAPDPRFGWASLLLLLVAGWYSFSQTIDFQFKKIRLPLAFHVISAALLSYGCYQFFSGTTLRQLIIPSGIQSSDISWKTCKGISIGFPSDNQPCSGAGQPCSIEPCEKIQPRGSGIKEGFRAVK